MDDQSEHQNSEPPANVDLDDEDLMLIAENAGLDIKGAKRKRILLDDTDDEEIIRPVKKVSKPSKASNVEESPKTKFRPNDDLNDFIVFDASEEEDERPHKARAREQYPSYDEEEYIRAREIEEIYDGEYEDSIEYDQTALVSKTEPKKLFEPVELEKSHLTQMDMDISLADIPERMRRRIVPLRNGQPHELEEEAMWIHKTSFFRKNLILSNKYEHLNLCPTISLVTKIKNILDLIRNQNLEVPFIREYRREVYEPDFNSNDLWVIYDMDSEWMSFKDRRSSLATFYSQMRSYQKYFEKKQDQVFDYGILIDADDISKVSKIDNSYELKDFSDYFDFYYGPKLHEIQSSYMNSEVEQLKIIDACVKKMPPSFNHFLYCQRSGVINLSKILGLAPLLLGENIREKYPKNAPAKNNYEPTKTAEPYINKYLPSPEVVLNCAARVWALQCAHQPIVRAEIRQFFQKHAKITCKPTSRGSTEIDENHPYYEIKYLRKKPVETLTPEIFLKIANAKNEALLVFEIEAFNSSDQRFSDYAKTFCERDEYDAITLAWNKLRHKALILCYEKYLKPIYEKEVVNRLYEESRSYIIEKCCHLFQPHVDAAADDRKIGRVVFALSLPVFEFVRTIKPNSNINDGYCAVLSSDGSLVDFFVVNAVITKNNNHLDSNHMKLKDASLGLLEQKINQYNPVSVVIALERKSSVDFYYSLSDMIIPRFSLEQTPPRVEIVPITIPALSAKSPPYTKEFPTHTHFLKLAISIGRYSINPLLETAQLFEDADTATRIIPHPLNKSINQEWLFNAYERCLIDKVNSVGVDLNRCCSDQRYSRLLRYISGLGPSKSVHIVIALRRLSSRINTRAEIITKLHMGPIVFTNCAGFLKINTNVDIDDYAEPFDTTRIHPESYGLAKKLLHYVYKIDTSDTSTIGECMLKIITNPNEFFNSNLDPFKEKLKDKDPSFNKTTTLDNIRIELTNPFKDNGNNFNSLTDDQMFWILASDGLYRTAECQNDQEINFGVNCIVSVTVLNFVYRRPNRTDIKQKEPREQTPDTKCPFCCLTFSTFQQDFDTHANTTCRGEIIGMRVLFENTLIGFISVENFSNEMFKNIESTYQQGASIFAKIISINIKKMVCDLSLDVSTKTRNLHKDEYYDVEAEQIERNKETDKQLSLVNRVTYKKKLIVHPLFKNVTYEESQNLLRANYSTMPCVIRPSSKGPDHLTLSIYIANNVIQHIDIKEEDKANDFSLGKRLHLLNEVYEDLDEIYSRFIQPYLAIFNQAIEHKYFNFFNDNDKYQIEMFLKERSQENGVTPYLISVSSSYPGKLYIAYLVKNMVKLEYARVTNNGIYARNNLHPNVESFITWFKEMFKNQPNPMTVHDGKINTPRYDLHTNNLLTKYNASTATSSNIPRRFNQW